MEKKKNGENYVEIQNANPEVLNDDNKEENKDIYIAKTVSRQVLEEFDLNYNLKHGVYEKIAKARAEGKYVPNVGLSKDPNSWQKRDKDWEFEGICDFEYAFTDEEKYCDLVKTDYVRFPMTVFVGDYQFARVRYFSGDTILGAAINCVVKKPINKYFIRNRKYYFDTHILNQTFQTLYEKGIEFNYVIAIDKNLWNSIFIYFGWAVTLKDIQNRPKKYDIKEDLEQEYRTNGYRNYLIKPVSYT